jgi:hypothetical protein
MANQKQQRAAQALLKQHNKEVVYINKLTGHMHFSRNNALIGAGGDEKQLEEVKAPKPAKAEEKPEVDPEKTQEKVAAATGELAEQEIQRDTAKPEQAKVADTVEAVTPEIQPEPNKEAATKPAKK